MKYLIRAIINKWFFSLLMLTGVILSILMTIHYFDLDYYTLGFESWAFYMGLATSMLVSLCVILRNEIVDLRDADNRK